MPDSKKPSNFFKKAAIREFLPEWQRCHVHFLRNALDYVPRKVDDDWLLELRWFYDCRELSKVRRDICRVALEMAGEIPEALRLGRGEHRGDSFLLLAAAGPSQAHEVPGLSGILGAGPGAHLGLNEAFAE